MACALSWQPDSPLPVLVAYNHNDFFTRPMVLPAVCCPEPAGDGATVHAAAAAAQGALAGDDAPVRRFVAARDLAAGGCWFGAAPDGRWACMLRGLTRGDGPALSSATPSSTLSQSRSPLMAEMSASFSDFAPPSTPQTTGPPFAWLQAAGEARRGFQSSTFVPRSIYGESVQGTAARKRAARLAQQVTATLAAAVMRRRPVGVKLSDLCVAAAVTPSTAPGAPGEGDGALSPPTAAAEGDSAGQTPASMAQWASQAPTPAAGPQRLSPAAAASQNAKHRWARLRGIVADAVQRQKRAQQEAVKCLLFDPPALYEDVGDDTEGLTALQAGLLAAESAQQPPPSTSLPSPHRAGSPRRQSSFLGQSAADRGRRRSSVGSSGPAGLPPQRAGSFVSSGRGKRRKSGDGPARLTSSLATAWEERKKVSLRVMPATQAEVVPCFLRDPDVTSPRSFAQAIADRGPPQVVRDRPFVLILGNRDACVTLCSPLEEGCDDARTPLSAAPPPSASSSGGCTLASLSPGVHAFAHAAPFTAPRIWAAEEIRSRLAAAAASVAEAGDRDWPEAVFDILSDDRRAGPSPGLGALGLEEDEQRRIGGIFLSALPHYGTRSSTVACMRADSRAGVRLSFFHRDYTPTLEEETGMATAGTGGDPFCPQNSAHFAFGPTLPPLPDTTPVQQDRRRTHMDDSGGRRRRTSAAR
eukprot:TRINITY_DN8799_c0_g1_i1.p1 TRINITY_DN8799_c0_g1~~TRINITY_DN8799_c0_g1_i1.p1  ORF type:complete len:728 (+),score=192.56 TRINITY_DN8799_c0_g1_i1:94-2184(+)